MRSIEAFTILNDQLSLTDKEAIRVQVNDNVNQYLGKTFVQPTIHDIVVRDLVWLKNNTPENKLDSKWHGPYVV